MVLSRKPGAGTSWDFVTYKDEGFPHYGPIRATAGKVKGWYLDINDTVAKLADGDQAIAVHGLFLIESARRIQKFDIYVGE